MRRVVVESPYAGSPDEVERNIAYARAALVDSLSRGEAPFASHLLYTQPGVRHPPCRWPVRERRIMTNPDIVLAYSAEATEGPWGHYTPRNSPWPNMDPVFGAKPGDEIAWTSRNENWHFIAQARTDLPVLAQAVKAVLALHVPLDEECTAIGHRAEPHHCPDQVAFCAECGREYPCPTVQALIDAGVEAES